MLLELLDLGFSSCRNSGVSLLGTERIANDQGIEVEVGIGERIAKLAKAVRYTGPSVDGEGCQIYRSFCSYRSFEVVR